jgi:glutathione S-transferase
LHGARRGEITSQQGEQSDSTRSSEHALQTARDRFHLALSTLDTRLGATPYLAGSELAAADIMTAFSLATMRLFKPYALSPWPNILAYLQRIGSRPAYRRAMQKADPDVTPILAAVPG